ncbi:capsular polysaccharide biosynthesis protein [Synergistales bacterium]|nr:capsular polysaccharide biosynthesis protein [Synergistales bacterium]
MRAIRAFFCAVFIFTLFCTGARANDKLRLVFTGDIMAHLEQVNGARRGDSWDFSPQFRRVVPLFYNALSIGNLETTFAGRERGFAGYPSFNTPDELAGAIKDLGIQIVTLSNNHIMDRGASGALRTTRVLDSAGILWTGLRTADRPGEVLTVEHDGFKIAFINYAYGSNSRVSFDKVEMNVISEAAVTEAISLAKAASPDLIVGCFHWGNEYQFAPTSAQRAIADLCVKNGVRLVIGTHPHVLQPIETPNTPGGRAAVAYSLGNFVSYQRTLPRERGVVLAVDIERKGKKSADISRVSVAPIITTVTPKAGGKLIEVMYAGESGRFNNYGLGQNKISHAREAGRAVLDFLGARTSPNGDGFYTIWDKNEPDVTPKSGRTSPK